MHENRRTRLLLAILLVAALALITISYQGNTSAGNAGGGVFGPVERLAGDVTRPIADFFHAATHDDASEIANLQTQNDQLRAELSHLQLAQGEATELKQLLQLSGKGGYRIVPASVIAAGGDYSDTITIDAGSRDGIQPNETVLNGDGLVGVVTSAGSTTATVELLTDAAETVGIRMAGGNTIGEVTGSGETMAEGDQLMLKLFNASDVLKQGEELVTFGSVGGRPYVPGVPVGTVTQVTSQPGSLTQTALVTPFADVTGLGVVGVVIAPPRVDPRDSVLPTPAGAVEIPALSTPSPQPTTSGAQGSVPTPSRTP